VEAEALQRKKLEAEANVEVTNVNIELETEANNILLLPHLWFQINVFCTLTSSKK